MKSFLARLSDEAKVKLESLSRESDLSQNAVLNILINNAESVTVDVDQVHHPRMKKNNIFS